MGDTEYEAEKVNGESEENAETAEQLVELAVTTVSSDPVQHSITENSQLVKIEPSSNDLEMPDAKGKSATVKPAKSCKRCKKTFYHLCALRSHVRYCCRSKLGNLGFNARNQTIKQEVLEDLDRKSVISSDSILSEGDNTVKNYGTPLDNLDSVVPPAKTVGEVQYFKGTKLKKYCDGCGLTYKSISHARSHISKKKLYCRKPPYICKRCGKVCKNIHSLVDHERSKVSCKKWLMSLQNSDFDVSVHSADESLRSALLGGKKGKYMENELNETSISKYSETDHLCDEKININGNMQADHYLPNEKSSNFTAYLDENEVDEESKLFFSCSKCGLKFLNSYRLRKHVLMVHRNINPQSTRSNPSRISSAPKKDSNNMIPFKCEGGYRCPTCEMLFAYPSKLSAHLFKKGKCYPPTVVKKEMALDTMSIFSELESTEFSQENDQLLNLNMEGGQKILKSEKSRQERGSFSGNLFGAGYEKKTTRLAPEDSILNCSDNPKQSLTKHQKTTHYAGGVVPFCEVCQLTFCNKGALNKHFQKYHGGAEMLGDGDVSSLEIGCPFCERIFQSVKARNSHVRYGHKELHAECEIFLKETQCEICARAFESVSEKQDHCNMLHGSHSEVQISTSPSSALKCIRCSAQFTTKHHYSAHVNRYCSALKEHSTINEGLAKQTSPSATERNRESKLFLSGRLKCFDCGTKFTTKHHYSAHVKRYCPARKERLSTQDNISEEGNLEGTVSRATSLMKRTKEEYICAHCETKFSYRTLYKAHVNRYCPMKPGFSAEIEESNANQSTFSCPYCQMVFSKKHAYETHIQNLCSDRPSTSSLSIEKANHGPWHGKKYSCWGCRNIFQSRKTLYVHQKSGCTGIPFEAGEADKSSSDLQDENSSGLTFTYVCRGCKKRFNSRKILYYHQKTVCKNAIRSLGRINKFLHDSSSLKSPSESSLICSGCQNVYSSKKSLLHHQKLVCKKYLTNVLDNAEPEGPTEASNVKTSGKQDELPNGSTIYYTCRGCKLRFQNRRDLYVHKITQCEPTSDDECDNNGKLVSHKTGFACKRCSKRCHSRKVLYVHQKFQCKYSKFKTVSKPSVPSPDRHLDLTESLSLSRDYQCHGCTEKFTSRKEMFIHHKYNCAGRDYSTNAETVDQEENVLPESNFETPATHIKYSCTKCKKGFSNRRDLHVHKKFHCPGSEGTKIKLPIEDPVFEELSTGRQGYACKMCQHVCADRKVLYHHHKFDCPARHRGGAALTTCKGKDALPAEMAEKLEKNPKQCPYCNRQYCNPFVRDRHIRLHTMVRAFHCSFCPQTFSRSEYLTRHLQHDHSEKLRYQCSQCGLKYAHRLNCLQHISKVHNVANKDDNIIDLHPSEDDRPSSSRRTDRHGEKSVPKLTLKRTSLVTRLKKKKTVWRPTVSGNVFRVVDDTPGRGIYSCDLCQIAKFTKMSALHRHWRSKLHKENLSRQRAGLDPLPPPMSEDNGPLTCSICHTTFPDVHTFVPHRLSHLNDPLDISDVTPYSCEICSSIFTHHQRVQGHLMWHLRISKSKSERRQSQILFPADVFKPIAKKSISPIKISEPRFPVQDQKSVPPQPPQGPFVCNFCSAQYASKSGVLTHMKRFCPKRFMCNKCGQCFSNTRVLTCHKARNDCSLTPSEEYLKCRHCSLEVDTIEDLGWHEKSCQKVHECEKVSFQACELEPVDPEGFSCTSCKATFPSLAEFTKHQDACSSVIPTLSYHCLQCLVCVENFYSSHTLKKHCSSHHPDRFYLRCLPCQKVFYKHSDLNKHIAQLSVKLSTTEDDRASEAASIECPNSSQSDSSGLLVSLKPKMSRSQKRKSLHKCQYCCRVFKDSHNLKLHMVVHKPFTCSVCKKTETSKEGFRVHACLLTDGTYATGLKHHRPVTPNKRMKSRSLESTPTSEHISCQIFESDLDSQELDLPAKVSEISMPPTPSTDTSIKPLEVPSLELSKLRGDFSQLMFFLVADPELMTQLGWGQKLIDTVLEDVLVHLGEKPIVHKEGTDLDNLRRNVHRFLSISIKEDILNTVEQMSHSSVDKVVSKMLLMCTETGDAEVESAT